MKEKERAIAELIEKENQAKKNVELYMEEQEQMRLQFEKDVYDKSKLYKNDNLYKFNLFVL